MDSRPAAGHPPVAAPWTRWVGLACKAHVLVEKRQHADGWSPGPGPIQCCSVHETKREKGWMGRWSGPSLGIG